MSEGSVIERLATKLAAAGLTEDEVALLRELIAEPNDVTGFGSGILLGREGWIEVIVSVKSPRDSASGQATGFQAIVTNEQVKEARF